MDSQETQLWTHQAGPQVEWASQVVEDVLEPELPIVDPHHHLFLFAAGRPNEHLAAAGMKRGVPIPGRYMLEEFCAELNASGHRVVATVYADFPPTCFARAAADEPDPLLRCVGETEVVEGLAQLAARGVYGPRGVRATISASADLLAPAAAACGACSMRTRPRRRAALPRRALPRRARRADPVRRRRAARVGARSPARARARRERPRGRLVARGLQDRALGRRRGSRPRSPRRRSSSTTAAACSARRRSRRARRRRRRPAPPSRPTTTTLAEWKARMAALARDCPTVHVTVGGGTRPLASPGWSARPAPPTSDEIADALFAYYGFVIEQFGARRCMFESNAPMDLASCSYRTLWNALKKIAARAGLSEEEKRAVFCSTAAREHRLDVAVPPPAVREQEAKWRRRRTRRGV